MPLSRPQKPAIRKLEKSRPPSIAHSLQIKARFRSGETSRYVFSCRAARKVRWRRIRLRLHRRGDRGGQHRFRLDSGRLKRPTAAARRQACARSTSRGGGSRRSRPICGTRWIACRYSIQTRRRSPRPGPAALAVPRPGRSDRQWGRGSRKFVGIWVARRQARLHPPAHAAAQCKFPHAEARTRAFLRECSGFRLA